RHAGVETENHFALRRALSEGWRFRPNLAADAQREAALTVVARPWWGSDPSRPQGGAHVFAQAAAGDMDYARGSLTLRGVLPASGGALRAGAEVGGGESGGTLPLQRDWFLGGPQSLRGFEASTLVGPAFVRGRLELARVWPGGAFALFTDPGWAGEG